ncbi:peptide chain release factor 1 [Candidatus Micrarchaeota archaeon]|nr:peptide chain release factor 1 [Candidatus Micrarchaeota archaeon]
MADLSKEMFEFKKQVEALKKFQGRGTELVSVYITPGYAVPDVVAKLRDEYGQASNIKSASTRKNVQAALDRIMHALKGIQKPPENGMAVFAGNVSESEGKTDYQLFSVVPPVPIPIQFYRCESKFVIEPLEELLDSGETYGLVVMDGKEATVALLKGKGVKVIKQLESTAHQKVHKGGQSAARYDRLHVEGVEYYYKRIGEAMDAFVGVKNFGGVIVGGPGPAKHDFAKGNYWNYQLKILGLVDTGYTDEYGIREVIEKSSDIIAEQEIVKEKKLLDQFMKEIATNGLVAYGYEDVKNVLVSKQASTLLITEGLNLHQNTYVCGACGKQKTKFEENSGEFPCECGGKYSLQSSVNIYDDLVVTAEENGIEVVLISKESPEGSQFYGTFKGVGAFLRYR